MGREEHLSMREECVGKRSVDVEGGAYWCEEGGVCWCEEGVCWCEEGGVHWCEEGGVCWCEEWQRFHSISQNYAHQEITSDL